MLQRALEEMLFHDTSVEALTRLSKKLDVMQFGRVSCHKDIRLLYAVYYREPAEDMALLLERYNRLWLPVNLVMASHPP